MAALDGVGRLLLALKPEPIDVLPRDAFERRNGVGANALMRLRMPGAQAKIAGVHHHRPFAAAPSIDIISVPPAITRSSEPDMMEAAAMLTLVMPDPQKRSSVTPLARTS